MKIETLQKLGTTSLGGAMILSIAMLTYAMVIEKSYLSYSGQPFVIVGGPFHRGDMVPMVVTRCNSDDVAHSYQLAHSLIEATTSAYTVLPPAFIQAPAGCQQAVSRVNALPNDLPAGRYRLSGGAQTTGIIRTFDVSWVSEEFDVLASPKFNSREEKQ